MAAVLFRDLFCYSAGDAVHVAATATDADAAVNDNDDDDTNNDDTYAYNVFC